MRRPITLRTCSTLTPPGFQNQFNSDENGFEPGFGRHRKHLAHHPVAPVAFEGQALQADQGLGRPGKGRIVPQRSRFALYQRQVVAPVVAGLATLAKQVLETRPGSST